jgi:hypothetical protein
MKPEALSEVAAASEIGRMSMEKTYQGQLHAASHGEFLSFRGIESGSAGYVAMERVAGTLDSKSGTFALMHTGIMTRGVPELKVMVVPDSATGELAGLTGSMKIDIVEGQHHYEFSYSL